MIRLREGLVWVCWFSHHRLLEPIGNIPPCEHEENFYGGLSITIRNGEIYVLFGGRPRRLSDPEGAPTRIVDV